MRKKSFLLQTNYSAITNPLQQCKAWILEVLLASELAENFHSAIFVEPFGLCGW
jgi:hypothetical protein